MRRLASTPSASVVTWSGGAPCHHVTTGASGASSGSTTDSACSVSRPYIRMTTASVGPSRPPTCTSASRRLSLSRLRRTTTSSRHGCAAAAMVAAVSASCTRFSSTTTTSDSASPLASAPDARRSASNACSTSLPLVSHRVVAIRAYFPSQSRPSWPPPDAPIAGEHVVGLVRAPLTGAVLLRRAVCPECLERVDHLPRRVHFLVAREQRLVPEQDIED